MISALTLSKIINYYKNEKVQEMLVEHAKNKEVVPKFKENFGKRPDTLQYPSDVMEAIKKGATSFHCSEELWSNPLLLKADISKQELDSLRIGWDLIIDIDCEVFEYSKIIASLVIDALKDHSVGSFSCKFSGNKGFHIGIPFEAFPKNIGGKPVQNLFPELPRKIVFYLMDYINSKKTGYRLTKELLKLDSLNEIANKLKIPLNQLYKTYCKKCGKEVSIEKKYIFVCPRCNITEILSENRDFMVCKKCNIIMEKQEYNKACSCGSTDFIEKIDVKNIMKIDTLLISSRHLYRMPYSLHEKTLLVSLPIKPSTLKDFEKEQASIENIKFDDLFIDRKKAKPNEARILIREALDFTFSEEQEYYYKALEKEITKEKELVNIKKIKNKISEDNFPPCIKLILQGLEDGKKRSLFILLNFLRCLNWSYDEVETLIKKWNEKNQKPLREGYIRTQINYHKKKNIKVPPPNCNYEMYYKDIGVCKPDELCKKITNPLSYAIKKSKIKSLKEGKKKRVKKN